MKVLPQSLALITNVIGFLGVLFKSLRWCLGRNGLKWLVLFLYYNRHRKSMRQMVEHVPYISFSSCSHSVASLSKVCRTWQTASPWPDFNLPIPPGTLGHGIRPWPVMVDLWKLLSCAHVLQSIFPLAITVQAIQKTHEILRLPFLKQGIVSHACLLHLWEAQSEPTAATTIIHIPHHPYPQSSRWHSCRRPSGPSWNPDHRNQTWLESPSKVNHFF